MAVETPPAPEAPTAPTPAATDARREQQARLRALEKKRDATVLQDEDDWTPEECAYAQQMIDDFFAGLLELPVGTRLRAYVAEQLGCDPRRVAAKFEGQGAARRDDLAFFWCAGVPQHRQFGLSHGQRFLLVPYSG